MPGMSTVAAHSIGPGSGTTMTVRLPLSIRQQRAANDGDDEQPAVGARRILVVDDNADAAASLAMLLELEGHATQVAHDGAGAIAAVGQFDPQVIFLDIGLPDISGYEVARRLRALRPPGSLPRLIALTGWGSEEDRRQAESAGFDAHLVKPVDPAELRTLLR
jgi:CheY-like chemotaxis protein